jgi:hypothetical protein
LIGLTETNPCCSDFTLQQETRIGHIVLDLTICQAINPTLLKCKQFGITL